MFENLNSDDNIKDVIKSAFDTDLPIDGAWGYTQASSTHITSTDMQYVQLEHMFASMRAYIEMNMTQPEEIRYGSINLKELQREEISLDESIYHKITYEITAIKELLYTAFIKEYKENYGKEDFDLSAHFQRRKEATLHREVIHWFKIR